MFEILVSQKVFLAAFFAAIIWLEIPPENRSGNLNTLMLGILGVKAFDYGRAAAISVAESIKNSKNGTT